MASNASMRIHQMATKKRIIGSYNAQTQSFRQGRDAIAFMFAVAPLNQFDGQQDQFSRTRESNEGNESKKNEK